MIQKTLPDDAFYYFSIARNVAAGRGVTVNGLNPTNGFHPLWALTLVAPFALLGSRQIPVGLTIASLFDVGAAWVGYRLVRRVSGSSTAALVTALFYALNPLVAMEAVNGLETALSTFTFALCACYYLTTIREIPPAGRSIEEGREGVPASELCALPSTMFRKYAILGALAGLMVLARTDAIFLFALMGLEMFWRAHRQGGTAIVMLAVPVTAFAVVVSPWLAWNQATFGTIVQSSGVALPYVIERSIADAFRQEQFFAALSRHVWPSTYLAFLLLWYYSGLGWTVLIVLALSLRILRPRLEQPAGRELLAALKPFALPIAAALLSILFHSFYRWYPRSWYYVPLAWAVCLWVGPAFAYTGRIIQRLMPGSQARAFGLALLGMAIVTFGLQGIKAWLPGFYPWQAHMYEGALWLAENTAPQEVAGAFNAGLQAYYSGRAVVNLDGVTDWEAFWAVQDRRLLSYARERGVRYIVDYRNYVEDSYFPYWGEGHPQGLHLVETLSPPYPPYGAVVVYEVTGDPKGRYEVDTGD